MAKLIKILLLEDNDADAGLIQHVLRRGKMYCEFKVVADKESFINVLGQFSPDVILSDNSMPQFNAQDALAIIKQRNVQSVFIIVTGTMSEEFAVNMIKSGADDYILKDRLIRLPSAIESAIRQRESETEKITALQMMVKSEEKYRMLVDRISDGFIALDLYWRIIYVNNVGESMLRRPAGSLVGKNFAEEFPAMVGNTFYNAYVQALHSRRNMYVEDYSMIMDKWILASIYPSSTGLSIFFRDVTEQRKAEEVARKSEEKYRILIERITDAFIALDRNWRYTYMNQQAGELIHRNPEDMIGKNIWEEFPEAIGSLTFDAFHQAMNEQRYVNNVDYYAPFDLWQENHIYPSDDGLSVFIRDITAKKRAEETLRKLEQERLENKLLEQKKITQAMLQGQEKERNAIGVELHDNVNQILVGTNMLLTLLNNDLSKASEFIPFCIENIKNAISENRKIAHELVTPDLANETLKQQVSMLCESMLRNAGLKIDLYYEDFPEERLSADQKLAIYRIAQEQCTNIIKYAEADTVRFYLYTKNDTFTMRIADDGKGMSEYKAGKGIGLRNIASRVAVIGGSIHVDTAPGKGFTLEVTLPVNEDYSNTENSI